MLSKFFIILAKKAVPKCIKWLIITVIACITWIGFIGDQVKSTGHRLYEQGQQLYMESTKQPLSPAKTDSVLGKHIEKNKRYE